MVKVSKSNCLINRPFTTKKKSVWGLQRQGKIITISDNCHNVTISNSQSTFVGVEVRRQSHGRSTTASLFAVLIWKNVTYNVGSRNLFFDFFDISVHMG